MMAGATNSNIYELEVFIGAKTLDLESKLDSISDKLNNMHKNINKFDDGIRSTLANLQGLFMSVGLSFLFTGMAVKNFTQNLISSLYQTYSTLRGELDPLVNSMNALQARWIAMKDRIIDVANQKGVFDKYFDAIDRLLNYLDGLTDDQLAKLLDVLIKIIIGAAAFMIIGQIVLFLIGIVALLTFKFELLHASMLLIFVGLYIIVQALTDVEDIAKKVGAVLFGLGLILLGIGLIFALTPVIIVGAILAVVGIFVFFFDYLAAALKLFKLKWDNFWADIGNGIGLALANGFAVAMDTIQWFFDKIISLYNKIAAVVPGLKTIKSGTSISDLGKSAVEKMEKSVLIGKISREVEIENARLSLEKEKDEISNTFKKMLPLDSLLFPSPNNDDNKNNGYNAKPYQAGLINNSLKYRNFYGFPSQQQLTSPDTNNYGIDTNINSLQNRTTNTVNAVINITSTDPTTSGKAVVDALKGTTEN